MGMFRNVPTLNKNFRLTSGNTIADDGTEFFDALNSKLAPSGSEIVNAAKLPIEEDE